MQLGPEFPDLDAIDAVLLKHCVDLLFSLLEVHDFIDDSLKLTLLIVVELLGSLGGFGFLLFIRFFTGFFVKFEGFSLGSRGLGGGILVFAAIVGVAAPIVLHLSIALKDEYMIHQSVHKESVMRNDHQHTRIREQKLLQDR